MGFAGTSPSCPCPEAVAARYPCWLPLCHSITAGWRGADLGCGPVFWEQHLFLAELLGDGWSSLFTHVWPSAFHTLWQSGDPRVLASCDLGASRMPQAFGGAGGLWSAHTCHGCPRGLGNTYALCKVGPKGLHWWLRGKESPCNAGDPGLIPEWGRSPEGGNGNHFSILAWEIPWTEEPGSLQYTGSQKRQI